MSQQGLAEQLFERGALMGVHIGRWGAMKKMSPNDLLLKEVDLKVLYLGHKRLLPKKALENFIEIEGKARRVLADNSIEFPIANARFVTYAAMTDIVTKLNELKAEWEAELSLLIESYPRFRDEQLELLEKQAEAFAQEEKKKLDQTATDYKHQLNLLDVWVKTQTAENKNFYLNEAELKKKFRFTWQMFRISAMDGVLEVDSAEVLRAQQQLKADLEEWVRTATASIHRALGEAAANAKEQLEKNGKLTPRNLKPVFDAFESFIAVDFTGKSTFRETIEEIQKRFLVKLPDGSYDLKATSDHVSDSQGQFEGLLRSLSELAVEDTARQAGIQSLKGDFGRVIDL